MNLLDEVKHKLVRALWCQYSNEIAHAKIIHDFLQAKNKKIVLDHFAIIDLPSEKTGIDILSQIFACLNFVVQGRDYLPEKQNEFLWLAEQDAPIKLAEHVLPQVVVADFKLNALPLSIRKIIEKYTRQIQASSLTDFQDLAEKSAQGNIDAASKLLSKLVNYLSRRDWALPTQSDFKAVHEANELLAWVLLYGRRTNHFAISVHLLGGFEDLTAFHSYLALNVNCTLNLQGNLIKGNQDTGIMQSATMGDLIKVSLAEGDVVIRDRFLEFIWRYRKEALREGAKWDDFHTGFIANNANQVIESLYD